MKAISITQNETGVFIYLDRAAVPAEALKDITNYVRQRMSAEGLTQIPLASAQENAEIEAIIATMSDEDREIVYTCEVEA